MKVLVANRGEIALRILRTCRELGFPGVAVYSDADREALHTRYADEAVYLGPTPAAESYLNTAAVLKAALECGAEAIHPGYGFLSENSGFAHAVEEAGLKFIGPRPETIELTGDKLAARRIARQAGLPVLPGPDIPIHDAIPTDLQEQVHFPVLIKAVAGGGGRGIRLANSLDELNGMITAARAEAMAAFGDDTVYLEPLVQQARHLEVQVLGDGNGCFTIIGERECSIQRRRQKLIEESPAPGISNKLRHKLFHDALKLCEALNYRSLGTVEFLLDDKGHYYFIEVNPRIQVEHPITEAVYAVDLVAAQLQLAAEGSLRYTQDQITPRGSAIEARILAEDPEMGFLPATGDITYLRFPGGPGIRIDSSLYTGMPVTADYDSLIAKVIAWGEDRDLAIRRLRRAFKELQIGGIPTDIDFLSQVVDSESFIEGRANTTYLDHFQPSRPSEEEALEKEAALAAAILTYTSALENHAAQPVATDYWQVTAWREQMHGLI
ncbi:MAG: ATP-grasp domain-containing protein [Chloroflexi bacterium]|nr:biotin carboxylase N-terminal domain-containing protein [Anaerolineaceae bacterium]NMB87937.1 ATP-grasp domain-containing protein [Chloroflexota bacterium]